MLSIFVLTSFFLVLAVMFTTFYAKTSTVAWREYINLYINANSPLGFYMIIDYAGSSLYPHIYPSCFLLFLCEFSLSFFQIVELFKFLFFLFLGLNEGIRLVTTKSCDLCESFIIASRIIRPPQLW